MTHDTDRHGDTSCEQTPERPWLTIDRESVDRVNDLDGTRADSDVGVSAVTGSDAQTGWSSSDVPPGAEARYEWLAKLQNGYGESDRQAQKDQADLERTIDVVCGQLGVGDSQREQIEWLLDELAIQSDLGRRLSIEEVVLAATSLVVDVYRSRHAPPVRSVDQQRGAVQLPESIQRESAFKELRADFSVDASRITDARERIRKTDSFSTLQRRVRR